MSLIQNVSRRGFFEDVFSAGALVLVACVLPDDLHGAAVEDTPADRAVFHPNVFLGLETDGTVYIMAHRSEMGNGSRTALPRVVADEMDADWRRVTILQAVGDPRYGSQDTDASRSILGFFQIMREAGATARLMLIRAAAAYWSVPSQECESRPHAVVHKPTNRQKSFGELALAASRLKVPRKEELRFKARAEWRYIGKDASLYDLKDISGKRFTGWTLAWTAWSTLRLSARRFSEAESNPTKMKKPCE